MLRSRHVFLAVGLVVALGSLMSCNDSSTPAPVPTQAPGTTPTGTPTSPPTNATFTEVNAIIQANCVSCHQPPNPSAGLDFTSYDSIVHNTVKTDLVVPGHPEESDLLIHANDNASLSGAELQVIHDWIAAGAPNN